MKEIKECFEGLEENQYDAIKFYVIERLKIQSKEVEAIIDIDRLIFFIEAMKEFRVKDKLPFNTVDYLNMDDMIEQLNNLKSKLSEGKTKVE